ncbi:MAG: serpin family protein [Candidatus Staskawiczbacteria bacterium]|nr:serpin family protein [Candidatus Staskawiczbacteria bacterium]
MTKKIIMFIILAILVVAIIAIGVYLIYKKAPSPSPAVFLDDSLATTEGVSSLVKANNQFAVDFYSKHSGDSNFFFSPYSVSGAMSMVYEGAKGDTSSQIASVFHLPDVKVLESSSAKIYNEINKAGKSYSLNTANALWAQKDYSFLPAYLQTVDKYYGGKLTNLDFVNNTENSRTTINKYIEDKTNNKIKDLIPQGAVDSYTRLVLTNAIYFKGNWQKQFAKADTRQEDFNVSSGKIVKADMMRLTGEDTRFKYTENDDVQVLNLPYQGNDLSMTLILPKAGKTVKDAEKYLSDQKLSGLKTDLQNTRIDIYIPKFKLETKYFMKNDMSDMGMPSAFSDAADFSGMTGSKDLKIGDVIHQAFVQVDEEGTEAAAATAVVMTLNSAMPGTVKTFRADHPFLFVIQQNSTGNILFLGRLDNPAK